MNRIASIGCAVGLAVTAISGTAGAATLVATYAGTVADGSDPTGIFGTPGANLAGDAFTAVFTVDTDAPAGATLFNGGQDSYEHGGSNTSNPQLVSATITISGVTITIPGASYSNISVNSASYGGGTAGVSYTVEKSQYTTNTYGSLDIYDYLTLGFGSNSSPLEGWNFETPYSADPLPTLAYNEGTLAIDDYVNNYYNTGDLTLADTTAGLQITSVQMGYVPVPEPSTWLFLLAGVVGLGAAVRLRRPIPRRA
jgi:hypothetical protein